MPLLTTALFALAALLLGAVALGRWLHARDRAQMRAAWAALEGTPEADPPRYDPAMIADLPEPVRRYFTRTIEPGTPLRRTVRLQMEGRFILNGTALPMTAQQVLAPPARGFVWRAEIGAGLMRFGGSDGYLHGPARAQSWTKFWLRGLIPLVRIGGNEDHARAAATRVMMEAIWVPAALLPQFGAQWSQTGPNSAEVRFADAPGLAPLQIRFNGEGDPVEVQALRWSDANPEKTYRLQAFGGRLLETGTRQGFRIPVRVEMGNLFGSPAYTPFFLARVTRAEY